MRVNFPVSYSNFSFRKDPLLQPVRFELILWLYDWQKLRGEEAAEPTESSSRRRKGPVPFVGTFETWRVLP